MSNPTQIKVQLQSTCIAPQIHGTENLWKRTSACHLTAPPVCRMCCSVRTLLAGNLHAPRTWHHKQFIFLCTFLSFMVPILIVQPWHEAAGAAVLHCRSAKMWKEKKRIQPVTNVKEKGAFVPKKENIRREASAFLSPWSKRKKYRTKKAAQKTRFTPRRCRIDMMLPKYVFFPLLRRDAAPAATLIAFCAMAPNSQCTCLFYVGKAGSDDVQEGKRKMDAGRG